jgi:hypothetical protein
MIFACSSQEWHLRVVFSTQPASVAASARFYTGLQFCSLSSHYNRHVVLENLISF